MPTEPRAVDGAVQHYAWGDAEFIPRLLGVEPDGRPWAELWLGTHPNGPAVLDDGTPLRDLTGPLPYLLKVLAASQPLSLQVHPDARQAADGFRRGVYPDDRAKPELLMALTDFRALCGIRPVEQTSRLLAELGLRHLGRQLADGGPGSVLHDLYRGEIDARSIIDACAASDLPEARLVRDLDARYPAEPSVAATLLMNHVELQPGEALHLTAGNLHAYLGGAGIELMGDSDNVVRGGLTVKEVDVDELLAILDPTPLTEPVLSDAAAVGRYPLPEAGCELVRLDPGARHTSVGDELGICVDGSTVYVPPGATWTPPDTAFVVVPTPS